MGWHEYLAVDAVRTRAVGVVLALVLHAAVVAVLAYSISFNLSDQPLDEPRIVAFAPAFAPPPDVGRLSPLDGIALAPRFRPRALVMQTRRTGDPALAVWSYLCGRDAALGEAVRRGCPSFDFGEVGLSLLDPLNRVGDVGALFGADTTTMTLDEAGAARGWTKPPPPKGQTNLAGKTDRQLDPTERFGALPWEEGGTRSAPYSWAKDRPAVMGDLR